jgi:protein involved in polysaccharide export with SLBB domain
MNLIRIAAAGLRPWCRVHGAAAGLFLACSALLSAQAAADNALLSVRPEPPRAELPATPPALPGVPGVERNDNSRRGADVAPAKPGAERRADNPAAPPGEFERLATEANAGLPVRRFGSRPGSLVRELLDTPARVPPQYQLQVGDEIAVALWGSVDADWRVRIDRAGRATLPRVGPVPLAGAAASELEGLLRTRLERVYRNFELSVAVTELSPLRVHITGFVERPGDYVVPGLSTISQALALAQGPAAGGSWRRIRLLRNDRTETVFDLYALLADGSRRDDRVLQPDDVLHVEAVGPQAALLGSVNRVAVFEFLPGETVSDLLRLGGGFSTVADRQRLTLERLHNRSSLGAVQLELPRDAALALADGDIVRAGSQVDAALPAEPRNKRVRVEGEVLRPGDYLLPPQATLADALVAAGGATASAFLFGTELRRESVRLTQEQNYERALQELESELERGAAVGRASRDDSAAAASETNARQLLARLRSRRPEGRMVLDLTPEAAALPTLALEDRDQVRVPARSRSIGVFGSVFNAGSFVHDGHKRLGDYLQRAGGPTAGADYRAAFVVRANGSVLSARQGGWWSGTDRFESEPALPGDTVFVPEQYDRTTWVQGAKDWTQILYQLGVGLAALMTIK